MSRREKVARLNYQYADLVDNRDIVNHWKSLILTGRNERWLDCADQILTYLKAEIEKCLLTDEEIEQIYFECGQLNKPSLHYLNERLAQAQVKKTIELLEEK